MRELCRHLRTKHAYGHVVSEALGDWREPGDTAACYWCLRTQQAWGPDQAPVALESCDRRRSCADVIAPDDAQDPLA